MDPLSVTASIVGILAATGKVIEILRPVVSQFGDATKNAATVLSEVQDTRNIVLALQNLLNDFSLSPPKRRELVSIDHLVAVFSDGVLLFSELEALVLQLGNPGKNPFNRARWVYRSDSFTPIISKLQRFKSSTSVLLNIVQCDSDSEADRSQEQLLRLVTNLLENNQEISQRLHRLENHFEVDDALTVRESIAPTALVSQGGNSARIKRARSERYSKPEGSPFHRPGFEGDLQASRAYRNARRDTLDFSFRSSMAPSHAWTALSNVSLSDISGLSVIALPIYPNDITNNHHYSLGKPQLDLWVEDQATRFAQTIAPLDASLGLALQPSPKTPPIRGPSASKRTSDYGPKGLAKSKDIPEYHVVVVGDSGVDKSQLCVQFLHSIHVDEYDPTVEDSFVRKCVVDDETTLIDVLDTTGQDEYTSMRDQYIKTGDGFLFVYSITSRSSFAKISELLSFIQKVRSNRRFPMMLVSNHAEKWEERKVEFSEGEDLARHWGTKCLEVSSDERFNIDEAFFDLVREIKRHREREAKIEEDQMADLVSVANPTTKPSRRRDLWFRGTS